MGDRRLGLAFGTAAYLAWGVFPLYWPLLAPASASEVLAHRVVWSLAFVLLLLTLTRRWSDFRAIFRQPAVLGWLCAASVLIAANWGVFIWAVNNGHVIETSLGYFINPLMSVLIGVLVLSEPLSKPQWWAVGLGAIAVIVLTIDHGRLPWISLTLASSFALYGFLKKRAGLGAIESLGVETTILFPVALSYLVVASWQGTMIFGQHSASTTILLILTGVITAIPLLLFGAAATRLPLSIIGLLQYYAPVLQFLLGLFYFGESMSTARWVGFVLVWLALIVFTADALRSRRSARPLDEAAEGASST